MRRSRCRRPKSLLEAQDQITTPNTRADLLGRRITSNKNSAVGIASPLAQIETRYGYTQDWLSSNFAVLENDERGNWWSDESSTGEKGSPEVFPFNAGSCAGDDQSSSSGERSDCTRLSNLYLHSTKRRHQGALPNHCEPLRQVAQATPTRMSHDLYELLETSVQGQPLNENSAHRSGGEQGAGDALPTVTAPNKDKELPAPPASTCAASEAAVVTPSKNGSGSPSNITKPSVSSQISFQRPRKRVNWRGKACIIALPSEDGYLERTGNREYLKPRDVMGRLEMWERQGYQTKGFSLSPVVEGLTENLSEGQSRAVYPSLDDQLDECDPKRYRVSIPDRQEWDDYVGRLKEDKLRALGVSFEDEESSSGNSPFPRAMSRHTSSHSSAIQISPPSVTSLSNINLGQYLNQISPGLAPSINSGPQMIPQVSLGPYQTVKGGTNHLQRYSMVIPSMEKASYQFSQLPPGTWSAPQHLSSQASSRVTSPSINGYMQGLAAVLSPGSMASPDHGNATLNQLPNRESPQLHHQQPQAQAPLHQQEFEQQQKVIHPHLVHTAADARPFANGSRSVGNANPPEIANPIPRGHRQNLSETLQKEIDKAESHLVEPRTIPIEANEIPECSLENKSESIEEPAVLANILQSAGQDLGLDNSDLDTNPSIEWTPKPRGAQHASGPREHSSKPSLSKMNANAPEFVYNPKNPLVPEIFAFSSNPHGAQSISKLEARKLSTVTENSKVSTVNTALNVGAPSFVPANSPNSSNSSRVFSFSASGPSFTANDLGSEPVRTNDNLSGDNGIPEVPDSKKIFSNINFLEIIKPVKKSRAIPIVRPKQYDEGRDQDPDGQEDESGRITQADGRQKRMRHDDGEDDHTPLLAKPTDEMQPVQQVTHPSESELSTDVVNSFRGDSLSPGGPKTQPEDIVDDIATLTVSPPAAEPEVVNADDKPWEPFTFQDPDDAANFNAAHASLESPGNDFVIKTNINGALPITEQNSQSAATRDTSLPLTSSDESQPRIISAIRDVEQELLPVSIDETEPLRQAATTGSATSPPSSPRQILSGNSSSASPSSALVNYRDRPAGESSDIVARGVTDDLRLKTHPDTALVNGVAYLESSYDEIDAVMKHLNEEDSDLGVERNASPFRHRSPIRSSVSRVNDQSRVCQLLRTVPARSNGPSPSPNRIRETIQYLAPSDSEPPFTPLIAAEQNSRYNPSYRPSNISFGHDFPVQRLNRSDDLPVSDWDDAISSSDEIKFQSRIKFFDHRINDLVGGIVQQRLQPLEKSLVAIQDMLAAVPSKASGRGNRRSTSPEVGTSDADDEGDSGHSHSRVKSPIKDRTYDKLKVLLMETVGLHSSQEPANEIFEILEALKDLKSLVQRPLQPNHEIKTIVEEAVARQMRGRSAPIASSHESATVEKLQLQITGLESMLKIAETRADDELKARRATEDALADNQRLLRMAMQEAAEQRESAEETERSLLGFHDERQQVLRRTAMLEGAQESLQKTASDLAAKNAALEGTLDEYRLSSSQWRQEVEEAKRENKDLLRTIGALKVEIEETIRGRQTLSNKFDRLQEDMTLASRDIARDQSRWRAREEEATARFEALNARLESELRLKEELESRVKRFDAQEKDVADLRYSLGRSQRENADLEKSLADLKAEVMEQEKAIDGFKREIHHVRETARLELQRTIEAKDAEIETASTQVNIISSDLQDVIARLRSQINDTTEDAKAAKARHEALVAEVLESRNAALREAKEAKEAALQESSQLHERILSEASAQHARALQYALEDKTRVEAHLNERLAQAKERILHLEDKSNHLEGKLEIAKSAAHAAVVAAQTQKAKPSPHASGTLPGMKSNDLPEKISPQALRESILVLQEQLQERESHIEQLEKELLHLDREAPEKLKSLEMENNWLRELLCVRVDDLEEIIMTLLSPSYDREAVRDAAIRIKANLQMEQQGKERATARHSRFPSLGSISTIASSPRALPLAAAAAWGNWRKAQDTTSRSNSVIANGRRDESPSRAPPSAPGFLSGLLTPPRTHSRQSPSPNPASLRPTASSSTAKQTLNAHATADFSRPLHAQAKGLQNLNPPTTPPLLREASYDADAESTGFDGEDGDVGGEIRFIKLEGAPLDEPFGHDHGHSST